MRYPTMVAQDAFNTIVKYVYITKKKGSDTRQYRVRITRRIQRERPTGAKRDPKGTLADQLLDCSRARPLFAVTRRGLIMLLLLLLLLLLRRRGIRDGLRSVTIQNQQRQSLHKMKECVTEKSRRSSSILNTSRIAERSSPS